MRTNPLLPLLRSQTQGQMLAELYLHPDRDYSLTDLARSTGSSVKTVHTEADRLTGAGFVRSRKLGNVRLLRADLDHRLAAPLSELLIATYGPEPVLRDLLAPIPGIDQAFVYGSWAARKQGVTGGVPRDVDVLIVGGPDKDEVFEAGEQAAEVLSVEVNIQIVRPERWSHAEDDPFLRQLHEAPLVALDLDNARGRPEAP